MKHTSAFLFVLRRFLRDARGNVAMIFAFMLVPLIMTIGYGAQYGLATNYKHQMQSAADAAALAGASALYLDLGIVRRHRCRQ